MKLVHQLSLVFGLSNSSLGRTTRLVVPVVLLEVLVLRLVWIVELFRAAVMSFVVGGAFTVVVRYVLSSLSDGDQNGDDEGYLGHHQGFEGQEGQALQDHDRDETGYGFQGEEKFGFVEQIWNCDTIRTLK